MSKPKLSNAALICAEYWFRYFYENDCFRPAGDTLFVDLPFELDPGKTPISFFLGCKDAVVRTISMFIASACHEDVEFTFHCDVLSSSKRLFASIARSFKECEFVQFNFVYSSETGSSTLYGPKILLNDGK